MCQSKAAKMEPIVIWPVHFVATNSEKPRRKHSRTRRKVILEKRIQEIFNIHPGEGRMVALVLIYAIALYFSNVMARTASMALFLSEYGADTLPYTYVF